MKIITKSTVSSALFVLGALAMGCSSDEDPPADAGIMDANLNPGDDGGANAPLISVGPPYSGTVVESTNIKTVIPGRKVRLFDVETGRFYEGEQTSAADGTVNFPARTPTAGTFVLGGGDYQDTWAYPPVRIGDEGIIRVGTKGAATLVPDIAGYKTDPNATAFAGSILWRNTATNRDEFVGCATIEGEGVNDVRYFTGTLPSDTTARPLNLGTRPPEGDRATPNNELAAGKVFIGNLQPGDRTIIVKVRGVEVGRTTIKHIRPRSAGTAIESGPSNLVLASIMVDPAKAPTNPQPADCQ